MITWAFLFHLQFLENQTRRFSNHESRLLSRLHTFAIIVIFNRFENTSKYVDTLTLFSKNLNQRSLTPRWPVTPCLLRSHVWLYPRIIVSKSHDDTSIYVDTVINFANYHIHTYTYYVHTTYYVQNEWSHSLLLNSVQARQWTQFRRDKKLNEILLYWQIHLEIAYGSRVQLICKQFARYDFSPEGSIISLYLLSL